MAHADHVDVYKDRNQEWRWRRQAGNGEVIATSGEGYKRRSHAIEMAVHLNPEIPLKVEDDN